MAKIVPLCCCISRHISYFISSSILWDIVKCNLHDSVTRGHAETTKTRPCSHSTKLERTKGKQENNRPWNIRRNSYIEINTPRDFYEHQDQDNELIFCIIFYWFTFGISQILPKKYCFFLTFLHALSLFVTEWQAKIFLV